MLKYTVSEKHAYILHVQRSQIWLQLSSGFWTEITSILVFATVVIVKNLTVIRKGQYVALSLLFPGILYGVLSSTDHAWMPWQPLHLVAQDPRVSSFWVGMQKAMKSPWEVNIGSICSNTNLSQTLIFEDFDQALKLIGYCIARLMMHRIVLETTTFIADINDARKVVYAISSWLFVDSDYIFEFFIN